MWWLFALVAAGLLGIGVPLLAIYGPESMNGVNSWIEFIGNTLLVFIYIGYGYRKLAQSWRFWLTYLVLLIAHCVLYLFALRETGPWPFLDAGFIALLEIFVVALVLSSIFHVSPQSRSTND